MEAASKTKSNIKSKTKLKFRKETKMCTGNDAEEEWNM